MMRSCRYRRGQPRCTQTREGEFVRSFVSADAGVGTSNRGGASCRLRPGPVAAAGNRYEALVDFES